MTAIGVIDDRDTDRKMLVQEIALGISESGWDVEALPLNDIR